MASIGKIYSPSFNRYIELRDWCRENDSKFQKMTGYKLSTQVFDVTEKDFEESKLNKINRINFLNYVLTEGTPEEYRKEFCYRDNETGVWHTDWDLINSTKRLVEDLKEMNVEYSIPIANFSELQDRFIIQNCDLDWVQDRLKEQYGNEGDYYDMKQTPIIYFEPGDSNKFNITWRNSGIMNYAYKFRQKNLYTITIKYMKYNESLDRWVNENNSTYGDWSSYDKCKSLKAVMRKLRKWQLPKGSMVDVRSVGYNEFIIMTK